MTARLLSFSLGCLLGMGVFGIGQVIVMTGNNPFEAEERAMPDGVTALSPYGPSPQAVSSASPLQSHIAGEQP